jgi:hypothetical protein
VILAGGGVALASRSTGNPGCTAAESQFTSIEHQIDTSPAGTPAQFRAVLQQVVTNLHADAAKSTNRQATVAIRTLTGDFQSFLDTYGQTDPQTQLNRLSADGAALDTACGN